MAKRFTATDKWSDKWFRKLSPTLKLGWLYLTDNCDAAGVIDLDEEHADFQVGTEVDWEALVDAAGSRIKTLESGKLWLTKFLSFQYGNLSGACPAHRPAVQAIEKHNLTRYLSNSFRKGIGKVLDIYIDKEKDKDKERGGVGEETFERFWSAFPSGRKKSKAPARKSWADAILKAEPEVIIGAATEYANSNEGRGRFVKMPSTWLNGECWNDDRMAWQRTDNGDIRREMTAAELLGMEVDDDQP